MAEFANFRTDVTIPGLIRLESGRMTLPQGWLFRLWRAARQVSFPLSGETPVPHFMAKNRLYALSEMAFLQPWHVPFELALPTKAAGDGLYN